MATTNITVKQRPTRIGYIVRPNELEDLKMAAELSTLLWGGLYNPIIPVAAELDETADRLVALYQIDVLHAVGRSDEITKFLARYPYLVHPKLSVRDVLHNDWQSGRNELSYLDTLNAIEKYWAEEFRHAPADHVSECRIASWDVDDPIAIPLTFIAGRYPTGLNLKDDFRTAFVSGLKAGELKIAPGAPLDVELAGRITPLKLSAVELSVHGGPRMAHDGVVVGANPDFANLVSFWNLRAAGRSVEFLPLSDRARFEPLVKAHLERLAAMPDRHPNMPDRLVMYADDGLSQAEMEATLTALSAKKLTVLMGYEKARYGINAASETTTSFDWDFSSGLVDRDGGRYGIELSLPTKHFILQSSRRHRPQALSVSLEAHTEFAFPKHTLNPPYRPSLNEFYSRAVGIDPWTFRSEREGLAALIMTDQKTLHLRPIPNEAVIEALFEQAGIKIEKSAAGRLADRLDEKLDGIEGARVFKIRGVRNLIASLSPSDAIDRGEATRRIWNDDQFREHETLYIESRTKQKLTADDTFDFLLKKDFFRAGLELKCDHCGLASWLSLQRIDDIWVCEFCGHENRTSLHVKSRGDWKFRKSGLFAKDNNQEGAIPVLLSLLFFARVLEGNDTLSMTSAKLRMDRECETDFLVLNHRDKLGCVLSEAKSAGGAVDAADIEKLKAAASKLRDAKIEPYFAFSKAAPEFLPEEIEMFKALHSEHWRIILMTERELEPYHPYWDEGTDVPHKYAHSLDEISRNSIHRYLR